MGRIKKDFEHIVQLCYYITFYPGTHRKQVISSEMRSAVSVLSIPGAVGSESDDATLQTRGD